MYISPAMGWLLLIYIAYVMGDADDAEANAEANDYEDDYSFGSYDDD